MLISQHTFLCVYFCSTFFFQFFAPVKLIVYEFHPQLSIFQQRKCWIEQRTAWSVTCQSSWTKFCNIWMVGAHFPPLLSCCRNRPVNTGTGPNESTTSTISFFTSRRRYCFKIWLITCISAGKKTDERISCTNSADETKSLPKGFIKASHCTRSKWKIDPNDIKAHLGGKWYNNKYINNGGKCVIEMIF